MSTSPVDRYFPEWTIADRLRRIRRDSGLTQSAFAERLGVGAQRFAAWEAGRNHPPAQEYVTIAKRIELAFGVAAEWTLGLTTHDGDDGGGTEADGRTGFGVPGSNPNGSARVISLHRAA